jgi:uncharacterized membrane protein
MRTPLLALHITAGIFGLLSGAAAMVFRKGSRRHGQAGNVFVISMLTMAACAVWLAILKRQPGNVVGGLFTFYLVGTAWATARRRGEAVVSDWVAPVIPLVGGTILWVTGLQLVRSHVTATDGVPIGVRFFMGSVMLLAATGDVRILIRGGVMGGKRIVRHLWRMCFGLFIATGSFFLGQQQVFPLLARKSNVLFALAILPLTLMIFWLIRVRFKNAYDGRAPRDEGNLRALQA